jgi:hypothetical protein
LPDDLLALLDAAFAAAREAGVKVILRFAYNYPGSEQGYEAARDAQLPVVQGHIDQLAPVIDANADTIVAMQAGFIGAWGEGHSSSEGLDTPEAKAAVRDALLRAVPEAIPLQWRYPPDVMDWSEADRGRFGLHNDCFLSSETDVGTYDEDPDVRARQRAFAANLTSRTYFSGETCAADESRIRTDCAVALEEFPMFHVSALNKSYYERFHDLWRAGGCYGALSAKMGYRLRLVSAEVAGDRVTVEVANDGWAAMASPRRLVLTAGGQSVVMGPEALNAVGPGQTMVFAASLPQAEESGPWCLSAPDASPRLAGDPRYAVRFANKDDARQSWDEAAAALCFR